MAGISTTSLSGLGLSGLSSGLDTSGIITKLMAIETAPQTALKSKLTDATAYRSALQSLNASVAALATSASAAAKSGALASFTATTSSDAVAATASSSATAGSISFSVDSIATAQVSYTDILTSANTPGALTFHATGGSATDVVVTPASSSVDDLVAAVNSSAAGVTATKVLAGYDSSNSARYRVQFQAKATGTASGFAVSSGSTYDSTRSITSTSTAAANAKITLFGGSIEQASNTFDLSSGVSLTVLKTTASASVTIAADSTAATTAATSLTASLTTLFAGIASASAVTTSSSSTGSATSTTGQVFTGDSLVRSIKDSLLDAVTTPFPGQNVSPSSIGITLNKDGTIAFDPAAFQAAMTKDSAGATKTFQAIAANVQKAADAASLPSSGTLSQKITSQQATESDLTSQISTWDTRLAVIQAQYTTQFNALETALQSLSSQASYLTGQISGLTTNYQNK